MVNDPTLNTGTLNNILTSILPKEKPDRNSYILEVEEIPRNNSTNLAASQTSSILALITSNAYSHPGDKTLWNSRTSDKKSVNSRELNDSEVERLQK